MLHLLKPTHGTEKLSYPLPEDCKALVAIGLSFPSLDLASQRVKYRINLVELRNMLASEVVNDDLEDESDDCE